MAAMRIALAAMVAMVMVLAMAPTAHAAPDNAYLFFPASCSDTGRECCPTYKGETCGGPSRGNCTNAMDADLCDDPYGTLVWFTEKFDNVCVCGDNFAGPNCGECKFGWSGEDCDIADELRMRRSFTSLSQAEKDQLERGFLLLKSTNHPYWDGVDDGNQNVSMYNWLVAKHHFAMWPDLPESLTDAIGTVEFAHGHALLSWHRRYLLEFEGFMATVLGDKNFTMPYWDPTALDQFEAVQWTGGDGNRSASLYTDTYPCWEGTAPGRQGCNCTLTNGPFASWMTQNAYGRDSDLPLQRSLACDQGQETPYGSHGSPTPYMAAMYAKELYWLTSHSRMSVLHRNAHGYIGQTMFFGKSPSDPIFFFLHSWIDLLQERWIRNAIVNQVFSLENIAPTSNSSDAVIGQTRDECMAPMFPLSRNRDYWKPLVNFGVTYAEFRDADPAVTTPRYIPETALVAADTLGIDDGEMDLGETSDDTESSSDTITTTTELEATTLATMLQSQSASKQQRRVVRAKHTAQARQQAQVQVPVTTAATTTASSSKSSARKRLARLKA